MAYASNADIEQRLGSVAYVQLTDDEGTGAASEARVSEAREAAEGEVNGYLARRYAVPVDVSLHPELAAILRSVTLDLAEYRLHGRRPPIPADITGKREASLKWLAAVAEGRVLLAATGEVPANGTEGFRCQATGPGRMLSRGEMADL